MPANPTARPRAAKPSDYTEKAESWADHQRMEQSSLYRNLQWRSIGPVIQGGRLVDIAVHPENPYTFYVAYASGGLWKTTDNGVNFEPLFDQQASMIMGDIAIDPSQPHSAHARGCRPDDFRNPEGNRQQGTTGKDFQ